MTQPNRIGRASGRAWGAAPGILTLASVVTLALACLYPAFMNGFPLLFNDSGVYLGDYRYPGVPPFYTLFVWITALGAWPWITIIVQSVMVAVTLMIFLRSTGRIARRGVLLATALGVLMVNQAPWLASWIMPDIFTGLGVAALCALLLTPERLRLIEGAWLSCLAGLATLTTTANGPLFLGLIATCLILRAGLIGRAPHRAGTLAAVGVVAAALLATLAANKVLHGVFALSSAGPALTFSRLADIGVAQPYLAQECRVATFRVCAHLDALNDFRREEQTFLFYGVADATDARGTGRAEYAQLVSQIVVARWADLLREGMLDTWKLLGRPTLGFARHGELESMANGHAPDRWIAASYPAIYASFLGARQQNESLRPLFPTTVFAVTTYAGYALLAALTALALLRGDRVGTALGLAGLASVAGELLLHGLLVGAYPRYHVKVAWLGGLFAATLAARLLASKTNTATHPG
jgi:hypothetical protein